MVKILQDKLRWHWVHDEFSRHQKECDEQFVGEGQRGSIRGMDRTDDAVGGRGRFVAI